MTVCGEKCVKEGGEGAILDVVVLFETGCAGCWLVDLLIKIS